MGQDNNKIANDGDSSDQQPGAQRPSAEFYRDISKQFINMKNASHPKPAANPSSSRSPNEILEDAISSLLSQPAGQQSGSAFGGYPGLAPNIQRSGLPQGRDQQPNVAPTRHLPYQGDEKLDWLRRLYSTEKSGAMFVTHALNSQRRSCQMNEHSMVVWVAGVGGKFSGGTNDHAKGTWAMWFGGPNIGNDMDGGPPPFGSVKMTGDPKVPTSNEIILFAEIIGASNALEVLSHESRQRIPLRNNELRDNRNPIYKRHRTNQAVIISSSKELVALITGISNIQLLEQVEKAFWAMNRLVERLENKGIAVEFYLVDEAVNSVATVLAEKEHDGAVEKAGLVETL
ncbi:uncharacterized protein BP5553_08359 [Venustampulla echinocandica]|uniref:Uncharacterized protein n=1 Tax=Venustampulla echinocandica TaxID=2656787 RepID=A0A370TGH4_9HELO|nr:uncharacterized protein BP5553_08359 [Venustampulla echinocandica]RDL33991.1 hypothetical protein BP5553_08359 [Venustampulla echinocandica]